VICARNKKIDIFVGLPISNFREIDFKTIKFVYRTSEPEKSSIRSHARKWFSDVPGNLDRKSSILPGRLAERNIFGCDTKCRGAGIFHSGLEGDEIIHPNKFRNGNLKGSQAGFTSRSR
jgi:hypothetical protein